MRICMLTYGTRGDIQPLLALGHELGRRGHSVVLAVNEDLAPWAKRAGIDIVPFGFDMHALMTSPRMKQALARGRSIEAARMIARREHECNESIVRAFLQASAGADAILSSSFLALRGQCLHDATKIPHRVIALSPFHPTRSWATAGAPAPDLGRRNLNLLSYQIFYEAWWEQQRPDIDAMCAALRIRPYPRRPRVESVPSLCCFSEALVPKPREWTDHDVVGWLAVSPELRARLGEGSVPRELDAWLDAGPPPVYFGFGSMPVLDASRTLRMISEVTRDLGVRGLVGAGWSAYSQMNCVDGRLFVAGTFDHDRVLPRCRAAVHHGGSGTTGAVLRAGIPAVVASFFVDQPTWGWRLQKAGAGVTLPFRTVDRRTLGRMLGRVLEADCAARARDLAVRLRVERGTERAADAVERWGLDLGRGRRQARA